MVPIKTNLLVGTVSEIKAHPQWAVVNLAHNYHYELHKWTRKDSVDHTVDPCYLVCTENPSLLSINWVDSPDPRYFDYNGQGIQLFSQIFDFIDKHLPTQTVGVVCNKGESRSPSVMLAYLAKRTNLLSRPIVSAADLMSEEGPVAAINNAQHFEKPSYNDAREKFTRLYPKYYPSSGITSFLIDHWEELR